MTKHLFLAVVLLATQLIFGQKKQMPKSGSRYATEKEQEIFDRSQDCIRQTVKSFAERLKNYPFSKACQIQLVSFKRQNDTLNGVIIMNDKDSLPRKNDTVCYSKLFEIKNLIYSQVDKLTDILYNYGYRKLLKDDDLIYIGRSIQCYNPRNAILFLDTDRKVFEYVEICFECGKTRESSERINLGIMCNQKLELLKHFFKDTGLEYGITKGLITDEQ